MEPITIPEVENYLYGVLPARDPVLAEMEGVAKEKNIAIVGPAVGRVLYQYARLIGARRIFEMGSAIGYSTIWLARALPAGGKVYYTDGDPQNAEKAKGYFERAGVPDRVEVLVGNALDLIQQVDGEFDLIFNDVSKQDYPKVFRLAVPRLRRGGLFISDNVFWSGRVGRPDPDEKTRAILEFNRLIYSSPEVFVTLLPLRDGLAVCHKL
jgi:caffeoyl-CoA O-methyltransferase